jgi:hypothetical protein
LHYDLPYQEPSVRNWNPTARAAQLHKQWQEKSKFQLLEQNEIANMSWSQVAHRIPDMLKKEGHTNESRFLFTDNIPGPSVIGLLPGEKEIQYNEVTFMKEIDPKVDWESLIRDQRSQNSAWYSSEGTKE